VPTLSLFTSRFTEIIHRTEDVISLRIEKPAHFQYKAGQFMFITIRSSYGQQRKHLTISSSPTEPYLEITKRLTGSEFCEGLLEKKSGDWVQLEGPFGSFVADACHHKIGMVCGGIGITPMRSMIRFFADESYGNDVILLYSNKTSDGLVFKDELDSLTKKEGFKFEAYYTLTRPREGWSGEKGRIDGAMLKRVVPDYMSRLFYTSGPPAMVDAMVKLLKDLGVSEEDIRVEYFQGYTQHPEVNIGI
jgi:ferredoxin-NADP reductase